MKRFCLVSCVLCILLIPISPLLIRKSGFTLSKISSSNPYDPKWEFPITRPQLSEIETILSQKFTYLASGNHCYTFGSEDGEYVIKFFKQKQITPMRWKDYLPIPNREAIRKNRKKSRERIYGSYVIAATKLKEETGTLYLHLNKSRQFHRKLLLIDQHGKPCYINLNKTEFLIQKRAKIGYSYLHEILAQKNIERAAFAIDSLFSLVATRCRLGILDDDCQLWKNFGFREGRAVEVDIGEFRYSPSETILLDVELNHIANQLGSWMNKHYPNYHFLITDAVHNVLTDYMMQAKK